VVCFGIILACSGRREEEEGEPAARRGGRGGSEMESAYSGRRWAPIRGRASVASGRRIPPFLFQKKELQRKNILLSKKEKYFSTSKNAISLFFLLLVIV
jgi:hypothetical protein